MMRTNPAGADIAPKELIGQIAFPSQELMAPAHGVLKMEIFQAMQRIVMDKGAHGPVLGDDLAGEQDRSEEHTSELQSRLHLVCRLLLEKKKHIHYSVNLRL